MTRNTRQIDPFARKDYSNMGRCISSFQLVHKNAGLDTKWRPRYQSSFANQSPTLVKHEIETVTRFKSNNASPSLPAAISKPSDTFGDVELSKQHEIAQQKRNRHRKKLRLSQKAPKSQPITSAVIPEGTSNETQRIKSFEQGLSQKKTAARKHVEGGEDEMDDWQRALAEVAKAEEKPCFHLLLKQLEMQRMRGY